MIQYQPWMFKASEWKRIPRPKGWNLLSYQIIAQDPQTKATPERIRFFDYTFACMMQNDTGWN